MEIAIFDLLFAPFQILWAMRSVLLPLIVLSLIRNKLR